MNTETNTGPSPQDAQFCGESPPLSERERLPITTFVIYVATFLIVWSLRATVFIGVDDRIQSGIWKNVYSNAVKFFVWVVPVFIILKVFRLRPLRYLKLSTRVNSRCLIISVIVVAIWMSGVVLGESLLAGKPVEMILFQRSTDWPSILAGVFFSPISEEILFRGFFLNRLNESLSFWKSNIIAAVLFVAVHMPYWVSKNGFSIRVMRDLVNVFLLGCLFGWVMKRTNSLWPAIGAHIANNFISGLIRA